MISPNTLKSRASRVRKVLEDLLSLGGIRHIRVYFGDTAKITGKPDQRFACHLGFLSGEGTKFRRKYFLNSPNTLTTEIHPLKVIAIKDLKTKMFIYRHPKLEAKEDKETPLC